MATRIEWCDETVNPLGHWCFGVGGTRENPNVCPYCYAERLAARNMSKCPKCVTFNEPHTHFEQMEKLAKWRQPKLVFIQSMGDLFHDEVPDKWIQAVFDACAATPQHVYMFLTKNPNRYTQLYMSGLLPKGDNYWYGTTVTTADTPYWVSTAHNTFLSIEPIMGEFKQGEGKLNPPPGWVIVGAMTGPRANQHRPRREWIEDIIKYCAEKEVPVFLKNSLRGYFEDSQFPQEYPAGMTE